MSPPDGVPKAVVSRLSLYQRELQRLVRDGYETTNSRRLGGLLGFTDAQVRKDLAYFGQFGRRGVGYRCDDLIAAIKGILGTDRAWSVALVGVGNLGRALLRYRGFQTQGFHIVAAFDVDDTKIGQEIESVPVFGFDQLEDVVRQQKIRMAMIAVPANEAQRVANSLAAAGVPGILNFAPVTVSVPESAEIASVDLALELEQLSFAVVNREPKP